MNKGELAQEYFKKGYNCSQAVFLAYAKDYGMDEDTALKLAASFGGGMGRMREVCGAVSGMFMVCGLETGGTDPRDHAAKKANYEYVQKLAEEFKKKSGGSIICKELLGLDKVEKDPAPAERTREYYQKRPCVELVKDACDALDTVLFSGK